MLGCGARGPIRRTSGQKTLFRGQGVASGWSTEFFVLGWRQTAFDAELAAVVRGLFRSFLYHLQRRAPHPFLQLQNPPNLLLVDTCDAACMG